MPGRSVSLISIRPLGPLNARGGEPCTGRGSDGFLLYHTASLRGSHLEGRSVRIRPRRFAFRGLRVARDARRRREATRRDRKSTRLNSSHGYISYAVFCLKKNNENSA